MAIDAALKAYKGWSGLPWQERASIFLKCADLISGPYRDAINASTMLGQSKTVFQAEIDAASKAATSALNSVTGKEVGKFVDK